MNRCESKQSVNTSRHMRDTRHVRREDLPADASLSFPDPLCMTLHRVSKYRMNKKNFLPPGRLYFSIEFSVGATNFRTQRIARITRELMKLATTVHASAIECTSAPYEVDKRISGKSTVQSGYQIRLEVEGPPVYYHRSPPHIFRDIAGPIFPTRLLFEGRQRSSIIDRGSELGDTFHSRGAERPLPSQNCMPTFAVIHFARWIVGFGSITRSSGSSRRGDLRLFHGKNCKI